MKALKVNFAPRRQLPWWAWAGCIAVLLAVSVDQGWRAWKLMQRTNAVRVEEAALTAQIDQLTRAQEEASARAKIEPPYAHDARDVAKLARFSLPQVLNSLESAQVQGIRLVGLEITAAEGTARADIEFSTHEALQQYLEAINAGETKQRWVLLQAQSASASGMGLATIASSWKFD